MIKNCIWYFVSENGKLVKKRGVDKHGVYFYKSILFFLNKIAENHSKGAVYYVGVFPLILRTLMPCRVRRGEGSIETVKLRKLLLKDTIYSFLKVNEM